MRVLFADSVDESGLALLRASGQSVTVDPSPSVEDLERQLKEMTVLAVSSTRLAGVCIVPLQCNERV